MVDRSRRGVLAGAAGVAAALAGCSFSTGPGESVDGDALRQLSQEEPFERPYHYPLSVPDAMVERHRDRAETLLERVPASPDVPNELVARRIADERERLREHLAATPTPTEGTGSTENGEPPEDQGAMGDEPTPRARARRRLYDARERRTEAATLWGIYRAATGDLRQGDVERRRDEERDRLATFRANWDYRASDPVRAALVHAQFEHRVAGVEHGLEPWPPFPADPPADTEEAGYLVGKVEEAAAVLDDLTSYREQVADAGASGYRPALTAARFWLRRRAAREAFGVEGPLEEGRSALEGDLGESVPRYQFTIARDVAREYSNRELHAADEDRGVANAVLFAATRRAAVATFADVVEAVESGEAVAEVSVDTIRDSRGQAHQRVRAALDRDPPALMERLLEPAFRSMREAHEELRHGASGTPPRAYAGYRCAERFARAAEDAADELDSLLDEATR